jgi:hypothetical protein
VGTPRTRFRGARRTVRSKALRLGRLLLCLVRKRLMQSALILTLIALGIVAKVGVLWRCFSRFFARLPLFCGMVTLSLARSVVGLNPHPHPYQEFWAATQWPMALLGAGAALEAFWRVAAHFRSLRGFGLILLGVMVSVAATVAVGVGLLRAYWNGPLRSALLFNQYSQLGLLVLTLLSMAFVWQFSGVPIRPNTTRHLLVLAVLFGSYFAGNFLGQASHGEWRFLSNVVINVGTVVAYGWWAAWTRSDGELLPFPKEPPLSMIEFAAAEATDEQAAREIRRVSANALQKVLRPTRIGQAGWWSRPRR